MHPSVLAVASGFTRQPHALFQHPVEIAKMVTLRGTLMLALATAMAVGQDVKLRYMPFGDSITEIICWRARM